jgi:hypothetical protein
MQPAELHKPSPIFFGEAGQVLSNPKYRKWFVRRLGELDGVLDAERMQWLEKPTWEIPSRLIAALEAVLLHLGQPALAYTAEFDGVLQSATAVCRVLDRACPNKPWQDGTIEELPASLWSGGLLRLHEAVLRLLDPPEDAPSGPKVLETLAVLVQQGIPDRQVCLMLGIMQDNGQPDLQELARQKADPEALTRLRYAPLPEKPKGDPRRTMHAGLLEFTAAAIAAYRSE